MRTVLLVPMVHQPVDTVPLAYFHLLMTQGMRDTERFMAVLDAAWQRTRKHIRTLMETLDPAEVVVYPEGLVAQEAFTPAHIAAQVADGSDYAKLLLYLYIIGCRIRGCDSEIANRLQEQAYYAQAAVLFQVVSTLRDGYAARIINEDLREGQTGILFLGAAHDIEPFLTSYGITVRRVGALHHLARWVSAHS